MLTAPCWWSVRRWSVRRRNERRSSPDLPTTKAEAVAPRPSPRLDLLPFTGGWTISARNAQGVGPGLRGLPRTPLLGTSVDKGKKKGRGCSTPRPALAQLRAYLAAVDEAPYGGSLLANHPPLGVGNYRVDIAARQQRR